MKSRLQDNEVAIHSTHNDKKLFLQKDLLVL